MNTVTMPEYVFFAWMGVVLVLGGAIALVLAGIIEQIVYRAMERRDRKRRQQEVPVA